jgi:hypothetical protein
MLREHLSGQADNIIPFIIGGNDDNCFQSLLPSEFFYRLIPVTLMESGHESQGARTLSTLPVQKPCCAMDHTPATAVPHCRYENFPGALLSVPVVTGYQADLTFIPAITTRLAFMLTPELNMRAFMYLNDVPAVTTSSRNRPLNRRDHG